jgi:hypothetical protein
MRDLRRVRLATAAGVLAASLISTGGALLLTSSPASANVTLPPVTLTCGSLTGSISADISSAAGTLSQCQIVPIPLFFSGSLAILPPIDISGATPSAATVTWVKIGNITLLQTGLSVTATAFQGDCTAVNPADIPATLTITATSGFGKGLTGGGVICIDVTNFGSGPLPFVNNGPISLSGSLTL